MSQLLGRRDDGTPANDRMDDAAIASYNFGNSVTDAAASVLALRGRMSTEGETTRTLLNFGNPYSQSSGLGGGGTSSTAASSGPLNGPPPKRPPFTIEAQHVLERAEHIATYLNHKEVESAHVLYAITLIPEARDRLKRHPNPGGAGAIDVAGVHRKCGAYVNERDLFDHATTGKPNHDAALKEVLTHAGTVAMRRDPQQHDIAVEDILTAMTAPHLQAPLRDMFTAQRTPTPAEQAVRDIQALKESIEQRVSREHATLDEARRAEHTQMIGAFNKLIEVLNAMTTTADQRAADLHAAKLVIEQLPQSIETLKQDHEVIRTELRQRPSNGPAHPVVKQVVVRMWPTVAALVMAAAALTLNVPWATILR